MLLERKRRADGIKNTAVENCLDVVIFLMSYTFGIMCHISAFVYARNSYLLLLLLTFAFRYFILCRLMSIHMRMGVFVCAVTRQ